MPLSELRYIVVLQQTAHFGNAAEMVLEQASLVHKLAGIGKEFTAA